MAISPRDRYPTKIDTSDPAYNLGKAQNITTTKDGTGTPWEADLVNDIFGFQQAILKESGLTASGTSDTADSSQYLEGIKKVTSDESISNLSLPYVFDTVAAFKASLIEFPDGKRIEWQGYYAQSDGGSNWGLVKSGAHTDDGGSIFTLADGKYVEANLKGKSINILKFGADRSGAVSASAVSVKTQDFARNNNLSVTFPAGTYKGNFQFDSNVHIICEGQQNTIFTQDLDTSACVRVALYSGGVGGFDINFGNCSIVGGATGRGLQVGLTSATGFSTSEVHNIKITGFDTGFYVQSALVSSFNSIWARNCTTYALHIPASVNVTTVQFNSCRFFNSGIGAQLSTGFTSSFNTTSFESNSGKGIVINQSADTGPSGFTFNECWVENNATVGVQISQEAGIYPTKRSQVVFNNSILSTSIGVPPLDVIRGSDIYFNKCVIELMDEIVYRTTDNEVQVFFDQCSDDVQLKPDRSMYTGLQPLTHSSDKTTAWGVFFKIKEDGNKLFANYTTGEESTLSLTATDATLDVQGYNKISVDTTAGAITLTEMKNAPYYTLITIVVVAGANNLTVAHSGGAESILLLGSVSKVLPVRHGIQLIRTPTSWMEVVVA
jgi:hypothetical protein